MIVAIALKQKKVKIALKPETETAAVQLSSTGHHRLGE